MDDSPDDIDMDLDHRFRPNSGLGGRIILLGDGTEISTEAPDSEMFDHEDEDRDLDSQVVKSQSEDPNGNARTAREETPGPAPQTTESPSSVQTEKSDVAEKKEPEKDTRVPEKVVAEPSEK
jgi:protein phosphatase 2C family protein 2/3